MLKAETVGGKRSYANVEDRTWKIIESAVKSIFAESWLPTAKPLEQPEALAPATVSWRLIFTNAVCP
jgi:hypothetical protein